MIKESEITGWLRNIKSSGHKIYSNCYYHFSDSDYVWIGEATDKSLLVVCDEEGVKRIWFYTIDFRDLQLLFRRLNHSEEYLLEIISKNKELYHNELIEAGFQSYTSMLRMANEDVSNIFNNNATVLTYLGKIKGEKPVLSDAEAVRDKLWEIFDARISHLPNKYEVENSIQKGEFTIYRNNESEIMAILQSIVKPGSFYINQIYNAGEKCVIHAMLLSELKQYMINGGRYLYAWVEESNMASQRFHAKYGMKHDGLWDVIYIKESDDKIE